MQKTRPPQSRVTIYEIAQQAGVSSSTVARVLRGDVKETWKSTALRADHIRQLAKDMGYRTNWRARAFSERRTWTVGLITTQRISVFDGVHAEFLAGFNDTLGEGGYHLMLLKVESDMFEEVMLGSRLDGFAMLEFMPEKTRSILRQSALPSVLLNSDADPTLERIVVDEFGGGYQAAQHLLELGHRDIGFYVNVDAWSHYSIDERRRGIDTALQEAGVPRARFLRLTHEDMVAQLVDPTARPSALICYSHAEAIPVMSDLHARGIVIPTQLSMISFNDVYPSADLCPPLTTVAYDAQRLGKLGAQLLLRRINQAQGEVRPPRTHTLKNRLTVRASTAPATNLA